MPVQNYPRITNPYMPNGTPDKTNSPTPFYAPGEIGCAFNDASTGRSYLRVKLDSGAGAAVTVGAVVAGTVAYWKDRVNAIVTNDKNQCDVGPTGAINRVAGIFGLAVTTAPGVNGSDGNPVQYVCDLIIQGKAVACVSADNSGVIGGVAIVNTAANKADLVGAAAVTTAPISQVIGVNVSAPAANKVNVDVNIAFID